MAITTTNRKVLTITATHSMKNTFAMMIDIGGLSTTESIEVMKYQKKCCEHMNNTAPSFFASAVNYGGNPVYTDLILEDNVPAGANKTAFDAEANAFYDANYTFDDLDSIIMTTDKIPYDGADTLVSDFITFQD
jgi:hypothetical protein